MDFWAKCKWGLARALHLDLTHTQNHYAALLDSCVTDGIRWLDVGCGRNIVPYWAMSEAAQRQMVSRCASLTGIDADGAIREHLLLSAGVMGLAGRLPFRDEAFDLVTANMVVEHVEDCQAFLADVRRVLKPGGRFVVHTPNRRHYLVALARWVPDSLKGRIVWLLEERREEDRFPAHYRMNTVTQVRLLAEAAGFQVEEQKVVGSVGSFGEWGPLGVIECFILKAHAAFFGGRFNSNLICVLRRQSAARPSAHAAAA